MLLLTSGPLSGCGYVRWDRTGAHLEALLLELCHPLLRPQDHLFGLWSLGFQPIHSKRAQLCPCQTQGQPGLPLLKFHRAQRGLSATQQCGWAAAEGRHRHIEGRAKAREAHGGRYPPPPSLNPFCLPPPHPAEGRVQSCPPGLCSAGLLLESQVLSPFLP